VISAKTCAAAVEGVAFFIALAVDPNAHAPTARQAPTREGDRAQARAPEGPPPEAKNPPVVRAPVPHSAPWTARLAAGTAIGVEAGIAPSAAPFVAFAVSLDSAKGRAWWTPGVRLSIAHAGAVSNETAAGSFIVDWTALVAHACIVHVVLGPADARLCALTEVGSIGVTSWGIANPVREERVWLALGGGLRLSATLVGRLGFELAGGAAAPVLRDTFRFDKTVVGEVSPIGPRLDLGLFFVFF
jgi:hypothetical protein